MKLPEGVTGAEVCVVTWPIEGVHKVWGMPFVLQFPVKAKAEVFVNRWPKKSEPVNFESMVAGATLESANGMLILAVRYGLKKDVLLWAWRNHPNPQLRWHTKRKI